MSANNWWAVDVFFYCLETHQQHHTLIFSICQSVFCIFQEKHIVPYIILMIDYPFPIVYNGIKLLDEGAKDIEL